MTDLRGEPRALRKAASRYLEAERMKWPEALSLIPPDQWPDKAGKRVAEIWRSRDFLLQVFAEDSGVERLSICRTEIGKSGHWRENVSWDDLQRLKRECGRGDRDAIEAYPADDDVVNVANMRHLWVMPKGVRIGFFWRKKQ